MMSWCLCWTVAAAVVVFGLLLHFIINLIRKLWVIDNIRSKHVLITGCDSGFGFDLALKLDQSGFPVIATAFTSSGIEKLESSLSNRAVVYRLDVTDRKAVADLFKRVETKVNTMPGSQFWCLVNNAGIALTVGPSDWLSLDDFQRHLDVNLLGLINMSLTFLPLLKKSRGRIVNMVSILGRLSPPFSSPYNVSKFAARAFTDALRREMKGFGIYVATIEPGYHKTEMTRVSHLLSIIAKCWDGAPCKADYEESYREALAQVLDSSINFFSCKTTKNVVDAYFNAIVSRIPKSRYMVGWDAKYVFFPVSLLPDWFVDFFSYLLSPKAVKMQ